jgi:hypothetical protein
VSLFDSLFWPISCTLKLKKAAEGGIAPSQNTLPPFYSPFKSQNVADLANVVKKNSKKVRQESQRLINQRIKLKGGLIK